MTETYKGIEIEYVEFSEHFTARIGEAAYSNKSLAKVKKHIDDLDKKDFVRTDVYVCGYGYRDGRYTHATITSIDDSGFMWVTKKGGGRTKALADNVFELSEENTKRIEKMAELLKCQEKIGDEIDAIEKDMTPYKGVA